MLEDTHDTPTPSCPRRDAARSSGRTLASLVLAGLLHVSLLVRSRGGENHFDYRFENYQEDEGRIRVETHGWLFEAQLRPWLAVQGEVVYDAISGATPTGAPPPNQVPIWDYNNQQYWTGLPSTVPMQEMHDIRWAGSLKPTFTLGSHRITPGFSYSEERDYISYGAALNYSVDLNEKNTTLNAGWSHNWDKIYSRARPSRVRGNKNADDILIGINQLLSPQTTATLNFTYGNAHGYLGDPYKGVLADDYLQQWGGPQDGPLQPSLSPERRPSHRHRYIVYTSLTQFIAPLEASVEGSYRFFIDSYGVVAHTFGVTWFQKIGKRITLAPTFRYYRQSAADFYTTRIPHDPLGDLAVLNPTFYSADYRLSEMETFTFGVMLHVKLCDWFSVDASYKRYEMFGLDGVTHPSAYPKANIVTIGGRLWF